MAGRIIGLISFIMCAIPFLVVATFDKNSKTPINFWAGDNTLKDKVKDIENYNKEMAALYKKCAIVLLLTGVIFVIFTVVGIILLMLECTVGIYVFYREYKKILGRYS